MLRNLLAPDNHLFALARTGHLRWAKALPPAWQAWAERLYPLVAVAGTVLLPIAAGLLTLVPALLLSAWPGGADSDGVMAAGLVLAFLPVFVLLALWLWLFEARPLWTVGLERAGALRHYLCGALVGFALMAGAVGLLGLAGLVVPEAAPGPRVGPAALGGVVVLFAGWVVQGAAEEAVTRGFLLPVTGVRWGPAAGVAVSSLVFAALHLANTNVGPVALLNLVLFGVFAALYGMFEGGIWGVCAVHTVWNWAQGNVFGLQVSGSGTPWSMLLDLRATGPALLTGGGFGPEGGLAVTGMLVLGLLGLAWAARRRGGAGEAA